MLLKTTTLFCFALTILSCVSIHAQSTINYSGTNEIFRNPERGLYTQFTGYSNNTQGFPVMEKVDGSLLDIFANDNQSLMLRLYYIPEFSDKPISQEFLDYVQGDLDVVREKGFKCIMRFAYSILGTTHADTLDAPLNRVLEHIDQLKPIFRENADIIAVMQAGLIGAYGEWATFNNVVPDFMDENQVRNLSGRKAVLDALLDAFPKERMVQIRTPYYKYAFYNWEGWTEDEEVFADPGAICPLTNPSSLNTADAYNGSNLYRTAQHNDCFLASATDFGTYCDEQISESDWLANETKYTVMGGETCAPNAPRSNCASAGGDADNELDLYHWSFLNSGYHPDVLQGFKDQGCYDQIVRSLGYRIELQKGNFPNSVTHGCGLDIDLDLENIGYAAPFNPRAVEFILRNTSNSDTWTVAANVDPRFWFKKQEAGVININQEFGIPEDMPEGNYELLMHLPDPMQALYGNPNYSIRLANDALWEGDTGFNKLLHNVLISNSNCNTAYTGDQWFIPFGCNPGKVVTDEIEVCCDNNIHLEVEQQSFLSEHTIGWAVTPNPVTSYDDFTQDNIIDQRGTSIDFSKDCIDFSEEFYITPFLAVNDHDYIFDYPDDLFQEYWATFQTKSYNFLSAHMAYDPNIRGTMKVEITNKNDYFSDNDGLSDIYIDVNSAELTFADIPTLPVGQPTFIFITDINPNTVWRVTIVDRAEGIGGVFQIKFTFSIPFPTVNEYCNNIGNSVLVKECTTSTNDQDALSEIGLFPNPAQDVLNISNLDEDIRLQIFGMNGKLIFEKDLSAEDESISLDGIENGMYLISISNGKEKRVEKLVVMQ